MRSHVLSSFACEGKPFKQWSSSALSRKAPVGHDGLDVRDDLRQVVRDAGHGVREQDVQGLHVLEELLLEGARQLSEG